MSIVTKATAAVLAVTSLIGSSVAFALHGEDIITAVEKSPFKVFVSDRVKTDKQEEKPTVTESETVSSEAAVTEVGETVSIKASTDKKNIKKAGRVISRYFSPYSANTVYNNIYVNNQSGVDIKLKSLSRKNLNFGISKDNHEPQVLILHTHATENYASGDDYYTVEDKKRSSDPDKNVVGIGNEITSRLKAAGINVIHSKVLHDEPSYAGSYNRSAVTVETYLKKYPSIKAVLDIHRDAIGDGKDIIKPVKKINGKNAAQVMICVGSNTGEVDYYPNWKSNLLFGIKVQQALEVMYPGLARPLYLAYEHCYNQNLSKGSIIIEFGTNGNTFEEAKYSAAMVSDALISVFNY